MNLWAIANLNKEKIFKEKSTFEKMIEPFEHTVDPNRKAKHVGLGWFMDERRGLSYQYHSGHDVGFATYHLIVPQESLGITVLCNTAPAPIEAIAFGVLDIFTFDDEPGMIRPHIIKTIGPIFLDQGAEAMKVRFYEMKEDRPDIFDFGVGGFLDAANSLLDFNQNELALRFLQTVLEIDNTSSKVFETLARAYFQNGDYENAIKSAQQSLKIDPDNPFLKQQLNALN
jgi:tetratricopeptide (TPR) repeat protein